MRARRLAETLWVVLVFVLGACAMLGCSKKASSETTTATAEPPAITDATTGLLLTWIDDRGEFHVEQKVTDVPEASRELVRVRVVEPPTDPPSGDRVFVVDLRKAGADGRYPVKLVAKNEFEDVAVERRKKHGAVLAAKSADVAPSGSGVALGPLGPLGAGGSSGDSAGRPAVIIYGASWCGPCHQAAAYLKGRGVSFVEHDIEKDREAAKEMQGKLVKAGARGGSIPVLDVRGRILVGFDPRAVDQALSAGAP